MNTNQAHQNQRDVLNMSPQTGRSGATLVEILMSLMVMSIGLVSVASMFPISMLRSAQATQLTNAGLLSYQCEDYLRAFPRLAYDDFNTGYTTATNIVSNVEMTPFSPVSARYGIRSTTPYLEYIENLPLKFVKVIDPVGASYYSGTDARTFGKDPNNLHAVNAFYFQAVRTNGGFNLADSTNNYQQKRLAFSMFASNDNWTEAFTWNEVTASSTTVIQLNNTTASDLETFRQAIVDNKLTGRAVIFSQSGKMSHVSLLSNNASDINTGTGEITLLTPIPNNVMFAAIPEVRLELFDPKYSCLITVRRQLMNLGPSGHPGTEAVDDDLDGDVDNLNEAGWPGTDDVVETTGADLVVFFRRDFSPFGEQVYEAGNLLKGLNAANGVQQITIRWNGSNPDSKPRLRNGSWVFDPVNGYWYQVTTVLVEDRAATNAVNAVNTREAVVLLDRAPEASGRYLMVPERVVEVFSVSL